MNEPFIVISEYPWQQAVQDGILQPIWQLHWKELTGDPLKPLLCTTNLGVTMRERWQRLVPSSSVSGTEQTITTTLMAIYSMYLRWELDVKATLPEEEQMFTHTWNEIEIWCIDDGATITLLLPSDY
jgi:hypothetical protein